MKTFNWKRLAKEIALFLLQILLSNVNVFEGVSPVGFPFAMARIFSGQNIFIVTGEYAISRFVTSFSIETLFLTMFEIVIVGLYYFSIGFFEFKKKRMVLCLFVAASKALGLYFSVISLSSVLLFLLGFVLEIVFAVYFCKLFAVYKNKFLFFKFSNLDYFIFACAVFMISLGLFGFWFVEQYAGFFIVAIVALIAIRVLPVEKFYVLLLMLSLAALWVSGDYLYILFVVISSVCLVNFQDSNKIWYACYSAVIFGFFIVIFKLFNFFLYFSLFFAVFCYLVIPAGLISKLEVLFKQDAVQMIFSLVQQDRFNEVQSKLLKMSDTLFDMQQKFKMLVIGKIDRHSACSELSNDIIAKCCKDCENYKFCFMQNLSKKQMIENILGAAIENNGAGLDSMGNGLQTYCMKKGILLNEINQMAKLYLSYEKAMKGEDESKLLISSELGNFGDIFSNFAKIVQNNTKINKKMSNILKENILNALIDIKETTIFENQNGISLVAVVSQNENLLKQELLAVIERVTKNKMKLSKVQHLEYSGLGVAMFEPVGRFKLDIAVSSKSKEHTNGDSVVVSKLSETKYFVAVADGMGHGENANKVSSMVLSLIKSMFEVGLDSELVVQSINKLLIPAGLDNFTTLDACVIDLDAEMATFIKLGSSISVIKHKNTSEIITGESLPMGVVQNIKPAIITKRLSFEDVIFLASDGVVDSFTSPDEFKCFINDTKIYNLQQHLDNIVFDAGYQSKHLDDMTIIGINLLKN